MKQKLIAFAVGLLVAWGGSPSQVALARDPDVPFPLSAMLPFPWGTIEGMWEAQADGVDAVFSFEIRGCDTGQSRKILKVVHLDPQSGQILAEGIGITVDDSRIVRAAMSGAQGNYMLMIGAYENNNASLGPKKVTVLTIRPFDPVDEDLTQVVVRKFSNVPLRLQNPQQSKLNKK